MNIIPIVRNPGNKFVVARVHYTVDPDKATPEWKAKAMEGMPESGWLREYEIDYSTFAGKPVFGEFAEMNIADLEVTHPTVLLVGIDFGYHRPAVLISMVNQFDQWCWLRGIIGKDEGILDFGKRIKNLLLSDFPGCKTIWYCDPAGHQKTDKGEKTSVQILNSIDIYPVSRVLPVQTGIEIIRQKLRMRDDGKVGLLVSRTETDLIDGFKGGYRYKEVKEGDPEVEQVEDDGYFIHIFDASRYVAGNHFSAVPKYQQEPNEITQDDGSVMADPNRNILPEGGGIADLF